MVSFDSEYEVQRGIQRWFDPKAVVSFTTFPDGTVTLDLAGLSHSIKIGPFEDKVIDEIIDTITKERR